MKSAFSSKLFLSITSPRKASTVIWFLLLPSLYLFLWPTKKKDVADFQNEQSKGACFGITAPCPSLGEYILISRLFPVALGRDSQAVHVAAWKVKAVH